MASGTVIGGNGGDEGSREKKQRWAESKVYSRKSFKGLKSNNDNNNVEQPQAQTQASDDSSSFLKSNNRAETKWFLRQENRVTINLTSRSKQEIQEVRRKLEKELDLVRNLVKKIEGTAGKVNNGVLVVVLEDSQGGSENVEKEKRTPKTNQFYRNSEFLLAKDKFPPAESNKKSKPKGKKQASVELGHGFSSNQVFKSCSALLEKLMKHKHGWVFNNPVDAGALGLHDYFDVIKHPMDLGTVKSRLNVNWYKSPKEFAEDVRLAFSNAMTYNPKGQDVHVMAEQLSNIFEEKWVVIEADYTRDLRLAVNYEVGLPARTSKKAPVEMRRILDRSESPKTPKSKPVNFAHPARTSGPKKPKANDPCKRDMTYEEKQKLSTNLQSLPSDKLDNVIQIIKKRNTSLCQKDDEIEVDIDIVDTETLWELDRFVTNYKKSLSKNKKKSEISIQTTAEATPDAQEKNCVPAVVEGPKETKSDEKNVSSSSPVQLEKPVGNASRSSSSSSSSSDSGSSSSDSVSENSSGCGSDAGHSPKT